MRSYRRDRRNRDDTIAKWKSDGDDYFRYVMGDTDNDRINVCTFRPILRDVHQEWALKPLRLWKQIAYENSSGQVKAKWIGGGDPSDNDPQELTYVPHVRCDWLHLGASPTAETAGAMAVPHDPTHRLQGRLHPSAGETHLLHEGIPGHQFH